MGTDATPTSANFPGANATGLVLADKPAGTGATPPTITLPATPAVAFAPATGFVVVAEEAAVGRFPEAALATVVTLATAFTLAGAASGPAGEDVGPTGMFAGPGIDDEPPPVAGIGRTIPPGATATGVATGAEAGTEAGMG